jgi:hypothetical protein
MKSCRIYEMRAAALAATTLLSGCALSSPYVKLPAEPALCSTSEPCGNLDAAVGYSRQVRAKYRDVLDQYAKLRSNSGAAAIVLGTAALGAALGDANRDVFTALGLLGAGTYGYASWYGNPPREALFGQTIQALVCAEGATIKLRFPASARAQAGDLRIEAAQASTALDATAFELAQAKGAVDSYLAGKEALVNTSRDARRKKAAEGELDAVTQLLDPQRQIALKALATVPAAHEAIDNALVALNARERAADHAGDGLFSAVDRIVAATDVEAQKTLPDPSAALTIVAGLGGVAGKFIPSTDAVDALDKLSRSFAPEGGAEVDRRLNDEVQPLLRALIAAQMKFAAAASRVARTTKLIADLATLSAPDAVTAIDKCTIAGIGPLSAVPASVDLPAKKAATVSVDLQGGKTPYRVEWVGATPAGVSFSQPGFADSRFVVVGTTDAAASDAKVKVTDGSGRLLEIAVKVK